MMNKLCKVSYPFDNVLFHSLWDPIKVDKDLHLESHYPQTSNGGLIIEIGCIFRNTINSLFLEFFY
jgi:hypothetical protein